MWERWIGNALPYGFQKNNGFQLSNLCLLVAASGSVYMLCTANDSDGINITINIILFSENAY